MQRGDDRDDWKQEAADWRASSERLRARVQLLEAALREGERIASTIVQHETAMEGALYALGSWIPEARRALERP